jgi:hypothetical protein
MLIHLKTTLLMTTLSLLCNLEPILGLHAILLLLDCLHGLIKLAQSWDIFMCNFIDIMNIFQLEFHHFYIDHYSKFFDEFNLLKMFTNKKLSMSWCVDLNNEEFDYLVNELFGVKYSIK